MLRVCYNGKRAYKSLKLSCSMKFWNEETSEVKSKHPYSINMNAIINQELSSLKALVLDYERTGTVSYTHLEPGPPAKVPDGQLS